MVPNYKENVIVYLQHPLCLYFVFLELLEITSPTSSLLLIVLSLCYCCHLHKSCFINNLRASDTSWVSKQRKSQKSLWFSVACSVSTCLWRYYTHSGFAVVLENGLLFCFSIMENERNFFSVLEKQNLPMEMLIINVYLFCGFVNVSDTLALSCINISYDGLWSFVLDPIYFIYLPCLLP